MAAQGVAERGVSFASHLAGLIRAEGPLRLDRYMALANAHYYATRDPLGVSGDFTTAPEISQLFGELVGLCLIDFWERSGAPDRLNLVELGPGRGTLMADVLRAAKVRAAFLSAAQITLVDTSPALRAKQAATLRDHRVTWAESLDEVQGGAPLYLIANEFFDALPIRQFMYRHDQWHEHVVGVRDDGTFFLALMPAIAPRAMPAPLGAAPYEVNEPAEAIARDVGVRIGTDGGIALVIDYGHARTGLGDTLQAVREHAFANPLALPGQVDLTAHVDFGALARAAATATHGPVTQGDFLRGLGIEARAGAHARARPDQAEALAAAVKRLTAPEDMGTLFKAMALTGRGAPVPAGFPP